MSSSNPRRCQSLGGAAPSPHWWLSLVSLLSGDAGSRHLLILYYLFEFRFYCVRPVSVATMSFEISHLCELA